MHWAGAVLLDGSPVRGHLRALGGRWSTRDRRARVCVPAAQLDTERCRQQPTLSTSSHIARRDNVTAAACTATPPAPRHPAPNLLTTGPTRKSTHPVPLVLSKAVLRVLLLQLQHHAVSRDLQDNSTARHSTPGRDTPSKHCSHTPRHLHLCCQQSTPAGVVATPHTAAQPSPATPLSQEANSLCNRDPTTPHAGRTPAPQQGAAPQQLAAESQTCSASNMQNLKHAESHTSWPTIIADQSYLAPIN